VTARDCHPERAPHSRVVTRVFAKGSGVGQAPVRVAGLHVANHGEPPIMKRDFGSVIVKSSPINGLGVFAARDFKPGEVIFDTSEMRLVSDEDPLREGEEERHCDWLADGRQILLPEPGRYINHSCDPNAWKEYRNVVRRCTTARRIIRAGEEITHDYCIDGFGDVVWQCNCRSERCRTLIHSDFFELPLELKMEYLPYLSDLYRRVFREKLGRLGQQIAVVNGASRPTIAVFRMTVAPFRSS
jgi:hypothetical protein